MASQVFVDFMLLNILFEFDDLIEFPRVRRPKTLEWTQKYIHLVR